MVDIGKCPNYWQAIRSVLLAMFAGCRIPDGKCGWESYVGLQRGGGTGSD